MTSETLFKNILERGTDACPYCKLDTGPKREGPVLDVYFDNLEQEGNECWQHCRCEVCEREWTLIYELSMVQARVLPRIKRGLKRE